MTPTRLAADRPVVGPAPVLDLTAAEARIDLDAGPAAAPAGSGTGATVVAWAHPGRFAHAALVPLPDAAELDALIARWLSPAEQAVARAHRGRRAASFVGGRVAASHAVGAHLEARGFAPLEPGRIDVTNDAAGCPVVAVRGARVATRRLRVSIAHGGGVAVALAATVAGRGAAPGIGIDVEPVEPRSSTFERLVLGPSEHALPGVAGDDRDTWLTRLWAAKEAAAKATGRGLGGRPKAFVVERVAGERLLLAGRWIETEVVDRAGTRHVVAITEPRTERAWPRS